PKVTITPNPLKLGSAMVGQSTMKDLTVANMGGNVTVTGAMITMNSAEFALGAGPPYSVVLTSGASFLQTIQFTPTMTGNRTGEVTFTTNDPSNPSIKVQLLGSSGPPAISLNNTQTLIFPSANVGAMTAPQPITVTNTGYSDLAVTALTLSGT